MYYTQTAYLNIQRRISHDHGYTWSAPEDLGISDQAGPPAVLPDGRIVLAWVDRFGSHSIRARVAATADAPFDPVSEVVIYTHGNEAKRDANTGDLLAEMGAWSFGLPPPRPCLMGMYWWSITLATMAQWTCAGRVCAPDCAAIASLQFSSSQDRPDALNDALAHAHHHVV